MRRCAALAAPILLAVVLEGCANAPAPFREDGPAVTADWDSPTGLDVYENFAPAEQRHRDWGELALRKPRGEVKHYPLYFEDPFIDQGHGRAGQAGREERNLYHLGWEDVIAAPYGFARFTLNWLGLPVSLIVQPPWMLMESDGELSKQALGYDHDAEPAKTADIRAAEQSAGEHEAIEPDALDETDANAPQEPVEAARLGA